MYTIYHNPRCSTSRNVLQALREAGHEPRIVEYLVTPLNAAELRALFNAAGLTVRDAIRAKEALYKELGLDDPALSDDALVDAIAQHPILLNRPFVTSSTRAVLCRPAERIHDML